MSEKLYQLTDEHRAKLKPWAEKWIANAMSTKPMDDEDKMAMIKAIKGQYEAANIPWHGRVVFAPSPFVARFASGFAAAIWWLRRNRYAATDDATRAATDAATLAATFAATGAATFDATGAATRAATFDATRAATRDATYAATRDATRDATYAATDAATRDATFDATDAATLAATRDATFDATRAATDAATVIALFNKSINHTKWYVTNTDFISISKSLNLGDFGIKCAQNAYAFWRGNNQWSGLAAHLSFFRHIANLPIDYSKWDHFEKACIHGGPMAMHKEFTIVSDRPRILKVDSQNRPHCDDGPFCQWSDGTALFAVHGVRCPAWIILSPHEITIEKIENEQNAEIRRIMVSKYGLARYIKDSSAAIVHRDKFGVLYRQEQKDDEPIVTVHVLNSTPENDGPLTRDEALAQFDPKTQVWHDGIMMSLEQVPASLRFKSYFIRVAPDLKPLPSIDLPESERIELMRKSKPQEMTARNAVASTFGMIGEQYSPVMES